MDERMRFLIRLKDGETMASLCREFGISRKTGYKIFARYEHCGLEELSDRTRRPFRYANQLPEQVEAAIVRAKREKPDSPKLTQTARSSASIVNTTSAREASAGSAAARAP
jgi:transposase